MLSTHILTGVANHRAVLAPLLLIRPGGEGRTEPPAEIGGGRRIGTGVEGWLGG